MKIETNFTKYDYFLSVLSLGSKKPFFWLVLLGVGTYSNFELIKKSITEDSLSIMALYLGSYYFVVLLSGILLVLFFIFISFLRMKNSPGVFGSHEFTLHEHGMEEKTSVNLSFHTWEDIKNVIKTKYYIYIVLSNQATHIIPIRSFSNSSQIIDFLSYFKRNMKQDEY